jgi:hypothetical protein
MENIKIINILICHLIGDYVLQIDYIANTKKTIPYHLVVHCLLYCVPFYLIFNLSWQLAVIFISHLIVDYLKCHKKISYFADQLLHYAVSTIYLL